MKRLLYWTLTPMGEVWTWSFFASAALLGFLSSAWRGSWLGLGFFGAVFMWDSYKALSRYLAEQAIRDRLVSILTHPGGMGRRVVTYTTNTTNLKSVAAPYARSHHYHVRMTAVGKRGHGKSQAVQAASAMHQLSLAMAIPMTQALRAFSSMQAAMSAAAAKAVTMFPMMNAMYRDHQWAVQGALEILVKKNQMRLEEAEILLELMEEGTAGIRLQEPSGVDVPGYVYGLRGWNINFNPAASIDISSYGSYEVTEMIAQAESWNLVSLNSHEPWDVGENTAECANGESHAVTHPECGCGYWAFWDINELDQMMPGQVQGMVRGWGNVLEASAGFRSEKAEIIGLLLPADVDQVSPGEFHQLQTLAKTYRCPIYRYGGPRTWMQHEYGVPPAIRMKDEIVENQPYVPVWSPPGVEIQPLPQPSAWRPD